MATIKSLFCSLCLAFTCFSRIPVPQVEWSEKNMRFMMAGFPFIGVAIGAVVALWAWLVDAAGLGSFLAGVGLVLIPAGMSGAIHLDGFCDVVDALSSHAEPSKKRAILKDPHVGAFAPICIAGYLLLSAAVASEITLDFSATLLVAATFVLSRCTSGFCVLAIARSSDTGMLASFQVSADKKPVLAAVLVLYAVVCGVCFWVAPAAAAALVAVDVAVTAFVVHMARKEFGGWSGDLAGFLLQTLELAFLIALLILQKAVML